MKSINVMRVRLGGCTSAFCTNCRVMVYDYTRPARMKMTYLLLPIMTGQHPVKVLVIGGREFVLQDRGPRLLFSREWSTLYIVTLELDDWSKTSEVFFGYRSSTCSCS